MPEVEPLLSATDLWRRYRRQGDGSGAGCVVEAVRGVSLSLERGERLAVVGRSGSGKSTLARLLLALEPPDRGSVTFAGQTISALPQARIRPLRRRFQAVFQDPSASLDPCLRVETSIAEPLAVHGIGSTAERRQRVVELLELVGLPRAAARRYPDELSGGERQRIAIARAIAPRPELLILDEPLSSLDATVQLRVLELIADLQRQLGLALLMISHDLALVRGLFDRVLVMAGGEVVESGPVDRVLSSPRHGETRGLVRAAGIASAF